MAFKKSGATTGFPRLFSPFRIGGCRLKNRIAALPVFTGYSHPDGRASAMLVDHYAHLAGSGAALVIVANAAVAEDGILSRYNLRVDKDEYIPGLSRLAKAIKRNGAIACLQLNHAGRFAKTDQPLQPSPIDSEHLSFNITSLMEFLDLLPVESRFSMIRYFINKINTWRRIVHPQEHERVISDFRDAASRACEAGFDMIELHGANGYLLCQFMSPFTNKLSNGFGGDFQRRISFPLKVVREIRRVLPEEFPVGFRLMLREWVPNGIDLPEALAIARHLEKEGIAYFSASVGSYHSIFSDKAAKTMTRPGYLKEDMAGLTADTAVPTLISGRIITPGLAERLLRDNVADLIGLGRPLRADFDWIKKAALPSRKIITCVNCNGCLRRVILEQGFVCGRWPKLVQERKELEHKLLIRNNGSLWVIADQKDMHLFQNAFPVFHPGGSAGASRFLPTILFLEPDAENEDPESVFGDYIQWNRDILKQSGDDADISLPIIRMPKKEFEKKGLPLLNRDDYSLIFMGSNPRQMWRAHLLYKLRGKAVGLLGSHKHQDRMIAAVDLSLTTSLIMLFLKDRYFGKPEFDITFIHVLTGPAGAAEQRWRAIKKVAEADDSFSLTLVPQDGDVVSTIIKAVHQGDYGAVIMGKRGISGIKRWLLGSVSKGVLSRLTDQSLMLID